LVARSDQPGSTVVAILVERLPNGVDDQPSLGYELRGPKRRLVTHAGDQRFAPHVLAALASKGSTRALGLLVKHLSDERAYVRRWTVESFAFTLRRDLAQPTLVAARANLKFADTRQAVDELLQEWQKEGKKSP